MDLSKNMKVDKKSLKYSFILYKNMRKLYGNKIKFIKRYKKLNLEKA